MGVIQKIKSGIIDTTANILSAPAQIRSYRVQKQAKQDTEVLKEESANKRAGYQFNPNEGDYTDPRVRTHLMALEAKDRLSKPKPAPATPSGRYPRGGGGRGAWKARQAQTPKPAPEPVAPVPTPAPKATGRGAWRNR